MSLDNNIHTINNSESHVIPTKYFIYNASLHRNKVTSKFCILQRIIDSFLSGKDSRPYRVL